MKINSSIFDDIRPYHETEIAAAMQRIAGDPLFPQLAAYVFPGRPLEEVSALLRSIHTIEAFQSEVMKKFNDQVLSRSIADFSYDGIEYIEHGKPYLFISNHRDIVLDSSLLQFILFDNGYGTTEITFGANLMCTPLVIDIGKSNKMFKVERGGNMKDFYRSSLHLSQYIRQTIVDRHQSVWIAQRNGRTKDGNDATDQGIIKMFCMSRSNEKVPALAELHLVPVAVSYEWESCDMLKALELYKSRSSKYVKKPGEDLNSVLTGIYQQKGRVHLSICKPLAEDELSALANCSDNEYHKRVATLIDSRIESHYRLYPNNFIAHDLLHGTSDFAHRYTAEQKAAFINHVKQLNAYQVEEPDILKEIFLGIYANPIKQAYIGKESSNY